MWIWRILSFVAILSLAAAAAVAQVDESEPACATRCWDNTKYVSDCLFNNDACHCSQSKYQKSLYQCVFSQCDTSYFNLALDLVVSRCSHTGHEFLFLSPSTPDRDQLRRREGEYLSGDKVYGSGSEVRYPTESASCPTESAPYPTESALYPTESVEVSTTYLDCLAQSARDLYSPRATEFSIPSYLRRYDTAFQTKTSAIPTSTLDAVLLATSTFEALRQVSTNTATQPVLSLFIPVAFTFFTFYFAL